MLWFVRLRILICIVGCGYMVRQVVHFARNGEEGYLCLVMLALLFWVSWHIDDFAIMISTMNKEEEEK